NLLAQDDRFAYPTTYQASFPHTFLTTGVEQGGGRAVRHGIEVNRRHKHVKSDPVDAAKLLNLLCRYHGGERKVWSVVNVATVADEDRRQLHRGRKDLQRQQTECRNRIKGLLASQGLDAPVDADFRATLTMLRDWAGQPVAAGLQQRILQEFAVWE